MPYVLKRTSNTKLVNDWINNRPQVPMAPKSPKEYKEMMGKEEMPNMVIIPTTRKSPKTRTKGRSY